MGGELLLELGGRGVPAPCQGLLEVGGGCGRTLALVFVDRLGLLEARGRLPVGVVDDLVGLALGVLEDAGALGV